MKKILPVLVALALLAGCGGKTPPVPEPTPSQMEQGERELQQLAGEALALWRCAGLFRRYHEFRRGGTPVHAVLHRHGAGDPLQRPDRALAYGGAGG